MTHDIPASAYVPMPMPTAIGSTAPAPLPAIRCGTCRYFDRDDPALPNGLCRRNAPKVGENWRAIHWPLVDPAKDWCGEHPLMNIGLTHAPSAPSA